METLAYIVAVVQFEDNLLILKRVESAQFSPGEWDFISRIVDTTESVEQILQRVLTEEVGLQGEILGYAEPFEYLEGDKRWIVVPYHVKVKRNDVLISEEAHSEFKWIEKDEISKYDEINGDDYLSKICFSLGLI